MKGPGGGLEPEIGVFFDLGVHREGPNAEKTFLGVATQSTNHEREARPMCQSNRCQGTCARLGTRRPEGCRRANTPLAPEPQDIVLGPETDDTDTQDRRILPIVDITLGGIPEPVLRRCA